jgi:hypothetical protein
MNENIDAVTAHIIDELRYAMDVSMRSLADHLQGMRDKVRADLEALEARLEEIR